MRFEYEKHTLHINANPDLSDIDSVNIFASYLIEFCGFDQVMTEVNDTNEYYLSLTSDQTIEQMKDCVRYIKKM